MQMNGLQRRALGFLLGEWISPATSTSSEIFLGSYVGNCYYKMQGGRRLDSTRTDGHRTLEPQEVYLDVFQYCP